MNTSTPAPASASPSQRTMHGADVLLPGPGGETLRVGLLREPGGAPGLLILCVGQGEGRSWREDPAQGLVLPAECLQELRDTLDALDRRQRSSS